MRKPRLHWVILPEPPDPSLSGKIYSDRVKTFKVRCQWCVRDPSQILGISCSASALLLEGHS